MSEKFPQITDLPSEDADAYRNRVDNHTEKAPEKPLSQSEVEESLDALSTDEVGIVAGARVETMLLDLEESPEKAGESFAERKHEIKEALRIIERTKPDERRGLNVASVLAERIEKAKDRLEDYANTPEEKIVQQNLAALELAQDVHSEVYWERAHRLSATSNHLGQRFDQKKVEELSREHELLINKDIRESHNSRVRENEKRRNLLEN